jgi:hypothetical protein
MVEVGKTTGDAGFGGELFWDWDSVACEQQVTAYLAPSYPVSTLHYPSNGPQQADTHQAHQLSPKLNRTITLASHFTIFTKLNNFQIPTTGEASHGGSSGAAQENTCKSVFDACHRWNLPVETAKY